MERVGIGIIGCGNISGAYLKAMASFPILEVRGVADGGGVARSARDHAARWHGVRHVEQVVGAHPGGVGRERRRVGHGDGRQRAVHVGRPVDRGVEAGTHAERLHVGHEERRPGWVHRDATRPFYVTDHVHHARPRYGDGVAGKNFNVALGRFRRVVRQDQSTWRLGMVASGDASISVLRVFRNGATPCVDSKPIVR